MRVLKIFLEFYLDASVHVALSVISLMGITALTLNIPTNFSLMGFVFFGTIVCYNFVKYGVEAEKYLIVSNIYHKYIQGFSFVCFVGASYFLMSLSREIWFAILILTLVSMLYAIPFLPNAKNLRSLGGFKIYIVALVWVGFTVLLPLVEAKVAMSWDIWILMVQRFVLVIILLLPFEIRDLQWDDRALKTLPQVIGPRKTQNLGLVLLGIFFLLTFLKDTLDVEEIVLRLLLALFLVPFFLVDQTRQSKYFSSFWVEGIPILWALAILLSKNIA